MRSLSTSLLACLLMFPACSGTEEVPTEAPVPKEAPAPEAPATKAPAPKEAPAKIWTLPEGHHPALLDPAQASETAPESFKAKFETTKGAFVVQVNRSWAPNGADRFYNLIKIGFYEEAGFFRTIPNFMGQFGISAYPAVTAKWKDARIEDDPVKEKNTRGRITFATAGPNTRTTQLFINFNDRNVMLDGQGFSPFGEVVEGMEIVDALHKTGEGAPRGPGPSQGVLQSRGNAYLKSDFPEIDYIKKITIVE